MKDERKPQQSADTRLSGEAAWKAHKEAIASRNAQARKAGREQRQAREDRLAAERRAIELNDRAQAAKLNT